MITLQQIMHLAEPGLDSSAAAAPMDSHLVTSPCCDIAVIGCCIDVHACAEADTDSQAQMQLLFAELKRIEGQQHQLQTAVAQNRVLVVHPPKGFHADSVEAEYAEEKEVKPDPDRFIPSGDPAGCSR